jgi:hypothetical protein
LSADNDLILKDRSRLYSNLIALFLPAGFASTPRSKIRWSNALMDCFYTYILALAIIGLFLLRGADNLLDQT